MAKQVRKTSGKGPRRSMALERKWRQLLAAWARSGLTQVAFCRKRGIAVASFGWWKRELARRDTERTSPSEESLISTSPDAVAGAMFVPVRVKIPEAAPSGDDGSMEIVVRGGRRVRVGAGFDADALAQVVAVLEGVPC